MPMRLVRILGLIAVGMAFQSWVAAQDWPGFHGLDRQGVALQGSPPLRWSTNDNVVWKRPIPGRGFSSPVVVGNGIYLTTAYETSKGAVARIAVQHAAAILAFALFAVIAVGILGSGVGEWPARRWLPGAAGMIASTAMVMTVLGICLFAQQVFGLEASVQRSWKLGSIAAALALCPLFFLPGLRAITRWLFVLASSLVGTFSYLCMPRRELFFELGSSDGITSTSIIVLPPLLACGFVGASGILSRMQSQAKCFTLSLPGRALWWRVALGGLIPAILVGGLFVALMLRVRSNANSVVSFAPTVGWTFTVVGGLLCLATTGFGLFLGPRFPNLRRAARTVAITVAPLLAAGCLVQFGCLPSGRQIAHAVVCVNRQDGSIRWLREVARNDRFSD
jgi:hypothetical protein